MKILFLLPDSIGENADSRIGFPRPLKTGKDTSLHVTIQEQNVRQTVCRRTAIINRQIAVIPRAMAVVDPLKLTITNYEGSEEVDFEVNQLDPAAGVRKVTFGRHLYIERGDFSSDPPPKYHRLKPGGVVRLKNAYIVRCDEAVCDERGTVTELRCTYLPESRSGHDTSGVKAKGVLHWVNAETCVPAVLKQYEHLLRDADYAGQDFSERMNPDSEHVFAAVAEPYLAEAEEGTAFQLMRTGYYKTCRENGALCLSEIVSLKDTFNK